MKIKDHTIKDRHDGDVEKCPKCLTMFVNFYRVDDRLLGCLHCGTVFVEKRLRDFVRDHQKEILARQKDRLKIPGGNSGGKTSSVATQYVQTLCACGFSAKSLAGLRAHQRKCENG